jgi:hypothetical protein
VPGRRKKLLVPIVLKLVVCSTVLKTRLLSLYAKAWIEISAFRTCSSTGPDCHTADEEFWRAVAVHAGTPQRGSEEASRTCGV